MLLIALALVYSSSVSMPMHISYGSDTAIESIDDQFDFVDIEYEEFRVCTCNTFRLESETDSDHMFLILLDEGLYNIIGTDLMSQWAEDVLSEGRYNVVQIDEVSYAEPSNIRYFLRDLYENDDLECVTILGDVPFAYYESEHYNMGLVGQAYYDYPWDYYYMELNAIWVDSKTWVWDEMPWEGHWENGSNGKYEFIHLAWTDIARPEIACTRIPLEKLPSNYGVYEMDDLARYRHILMEAHNWRAEPNDGTNWACLIYSDQEATQEEVIEQAIEDLFPSQTTIKSPTNNNDFQFKLMEDYIWIIPHVHGSSTRHTWDPNFSPTYTDCYELTPEHFTPRFITVKSCLAGDFTHPNCIGTSYIGQAHMLAIFCDSKLDHCLSIEESFYDEIDSGGTLGDAIFSYYDDCFPVHMYTPYSDIWYYSGQHVYGDGSLIPVIYR